MTQDEYDWSFFVQKVQLGGKFYPCLNKIKKGMGYFIPHFPNPNSSWTD
jgi:hypothetical protein